MAQRYRSCPDPDSYGSWHCASTSARHETGVRKAVGAVQRQLIMQFLGEAVIHVALAMALDGTLTELLLPWMNSALKQTVVFNYLREPAPLDALVATTVGLGLAVGLTRFLSYQHIGRPRS